MPRAALEIRVRGRITDEAAERLADAYPLEVAETVLRGEIADQAELHGILDRLQALGYELLAVRRTPRD